MKKVLLLAAVIAATTTISLSAQYRVPQQTSYAMNAAEKENLKIAHDFWRDIMLGGNLDIASHYMPADFISRNPNVAAGRDAFVTALRERPGLFQNTRIQRAGTPEVEFAKNDYVFFMWANFVIDPIEPAKIFKYNTLDLFRIVNGKVVEHWDGAHKRVAGDFGPKSMGGGVYNSSTNLTPKEQETRKLGMVEFKDILQYGHTELALQAMAPGYMQHNMNVPGGRDNFIKNFSSRPKSDIKDAWVTPPTLELISGNFYLKFDQRMEKDATDPNKMAVFYRFDMVRVDDGLIQEHWDVAYPNGMKLPY
jgi:predicted SnoaL-like aldol condensation-catalyzing enzyme